METLVIASIVFFPHYFWALITVAVIRKWYIFDNCRYLQGLFVRILVDNDDDNDCDDDEH